MKFFFKYPYKIWAAEFKFVIEISINRLFIELSTYRYAKFQKSCQTLMGSYRLEVAEFKFVIEISINRLFIKLSIDRYAKFQKSCQTVSDLANLGGRNRISVKV